MANKLPREIAPGVFWIGDCLAQRHKGKIYHGYNAAFLVAGETASCLVETGHPKDFPVIARHMNELFARGVAPLKYLFVTHQETPHCGGLGRILKAHPEAILCGDVSDYHLAFPQYEHRMRWMKEGDEIDLETRYGLYRYRVTDSVVVNPDNRTALITDANGYHLTLTTCWPLWAGAFATQRYIIHTDQVWPVPIRPGYT